MYLAYNISIWINCGIPSPTNRNYCWRTFWFSNQLSFDCQIPICMLWNIDEYLFASIKLTIWVCGMGSVILTVHDVMVSSVSLTRLGCIAIHDQYYVLIITDDSQTDISDILPSVCYLVNHLLSANVHNGSFC